ncbi:hypothetical protein [Pediococcus acidilactici]|nr:hypothetical protein [Pediococcus acidilactici]
MKFKPANNKNQSPFFKLDISIGAGFRSLGGRRLAPQEEQLKHLR